MPQANTACQCGCACGCILQYSPLHSNSFMFRSSTGGCMIHSLRHSACHASAASTALQATSASSNQNYAGILILFRLQPAQQAQLPTARIPQHCKHAAEDTLMHTKLSRAKLAKAAAGTARLSKASKARQSSAQQSKFAKQGSAQSRFAKQGSATQDLQQSRHSLGGSGSKARKQSLNAS